MSTDMESLQSPLPMDLPAKPTSPVEIAFIHKKLANNKFPGHDLISDIVAKNLPIKVLVNLSNIYNTALRIPYFPTMYLEIISHCHSTETWQASKKFLLVQAH